MAELLRQMWKFHGCLGYDAGVQKYGDLPDEKVAWHDQQASAIALWQTEGTDDWVDRGKIDSTPF